MKTLFRTTVAALVGALFLGVLPAAAGAAPAASSQATYCPAPKTKAFDAAVTDYYNKRNTAIITRAEWLKKVRIVNAVNPADRAAVTDAFKNAAFWLNKTRAQVASQQKAYAGLKAMVTDPNSKGCAQYRLPKFAKAPKPISM